MDAPNDYKNVGIFMIVSGVLSIMLSGIILLSTMCVYFPAFFSLATGITEVVFGIAILQGQARPSAMAVAILGLIGSFMVCDWIGTVAEILSLVMLNKPEVTDWLRANR